MEHKGTVTLETPRLILRRFEPADLEPMFENCWRHADVTKWTSYAPMHCLEDVRESAGMFTEKWLRYDDPKRYSWAIVDKANWIDLPMRYQPYKKINEKLLRMFLK